jgi:Uncharacterised nucleotidyltransferase
MLMLGVRQMNRGLPEAVIATFREEERGAHRERLGRFTVRDWRRHIHWLDTSGLALYFLNRITTLGLEKSVPVTVLGELQQRYTDNQLRTRDLFDEFALINKKFQMAGLRYVNLKGFSLVPEYCPDPSLRYQLDLDFLMSPSDAPRCCEILRGFGYVAYRPDDSVLEFRAGMEQVPSIRDLYKPKPRRSVEVHFSISLREPASALLARSRMHSMNGLGFPALSEADLLLAHTLHLFKHLKGEWVRVSWLLEFQTFVAAHRDHSTFWREVHALATRVPEGVLGLGVVTWFATRAFGGFAPPELTEWTVNALPQPVRLWLERYARTVLLTDFPGTKLYLLLRSELSSGLNSRRMVTRGKLLPLHRPPQVAYVAGGSIGSKVRVLVDQLRFVLFRLRFHIVESSRYLFEAQRWKRVVNSSQT